jgi:hypothetical protein
MNGVDDYKYRDLPLSPQIIAEIAVRKFAGQVVKRDAIRAAVVAHHLENGGQLSLTDPLIQTKKALSDLASKGLAEKTGAYGLWRFPDRDDAFTVEETEDDLLDPSDSYNPITVLEWVGVGSQLVYVYSFPTYADHAHVSGELLWPCKIGRSDRQSIDRISEQVGTSSPEWPIVYLAIRCDDSRLLERYLHSALRLSGNYLADVPGAEWFRTSPNKVKELVSSVAPHLLDGSSSPKL